ncbi:uncharacterized protein LOC143040624 [Oratosquilla oratoria]|uniref:uncharacterized protein LOC143040624 n=1 Tax=Oratosquilla oratoria TaxID=337810 RepID=UPI003F759BA5
MVRFARAEGSKGSNKRQLEEPTPWEEMKLQTGTDDEVTSVVKEKKKKKKQEVEVSENGKANEGPGDAENKVEDPDNEDSKVLQNSSVEDLSPDSEDKQMENGHEEKTLSRREKKKLKLEKKSEEGDKPEFILNDKGQRVKVFKDGKERLYFDLPYEEGERMTRFEGFWVKTDVVESLKSLKASLKSEGIEEKEMRRKMMKMKRKAHKELRMELVLEQKALLPENKQEGINKEDTDTTTKTDAGANKLKKKNKRSNKLKAKEPEANGSLEAKTEMNGLCKDAEGQDESLQKNCLVPKAVLQGNPVQEDDKEEEKVDDQPHARQNKNWVSKEKEFVPLKFEENNTMTEFDGYWVRRTEVSKLHAIKQNKIKKIKELRGDGNQDDLTAEEQLKLNREMKKIKRNEHRQLKMSLIAEGQKKNKDSGRNMYDRRETPRRPKKPGRSLGINYTEQRGDMVKFDGYWVKVESAERLKQLKERLTSEGVPKEEINAVIKLQRRKEERVLKNEKKLVCFKCRQPGHFVSSCPTVLNQGVPYNSEGNDLCYKCGSTEHMSRQCTVKRKGSEFSHAVCFVCRESGHIAKECPDNPRGLYPKGGACKQCGSVEHLRKDCPEVQAENEQNTLKAEIMDTRAIDALDSFESENFGKNSYPSPMKKRKIIKYNI